jgi:hypothetical protein
VVRTHSSWLDFCLFAVFKWFVWRLEVAEHHRAGLDQAAITFRDEAFASAAIKMENSNEKSMEISEKIAQIGAGSITHPSAVGTTIAKLTTLIALIATVESNKVKIHRSTEGRSKFPLNSPSKTQFASRIKTNRL